MCAQMSGCAPDHTGVGLHQTELPAETGKEPEDSQPPYAKLQMTTGFKRGPGHKGQKKKWMETGKKNKPAS